MRPRARERPISTLFLIPAASIRPKSSSSSAIPSRPASETTPEALPPFISSFILASFSLLSPLRSSTGSMTLTASGLRPFWSISSSTASSPILSILSMATVMSTTLSGKPAISARPVSSLRLFIFTQTLTPKRRNTLSTICTSSSSLSWEVEPMTSTSHW